MAPANRAPSAARGAAVRRPVREAHAGREVEVEDRPRSPAPTGRARSRRSGSSRRRDRPGCARRPAGCGATSRHSTSTRVTFVPVAARASRRASRAGPRTLTRSSSCSERIGAAAADPASAASASSAASARGETPHGTGLRRATVTRAPRARTRSSRATRRPSTATAATGPAAAAHRAQGARAGGQHPPPVGHRHGSAAHRDARHAGPPPDGARRRPSRDPRGSGARPPPPRTATATRPRDAHTRRAGPGRAVVAIAPSPASPAGARASTAGAAGSTHARQARRQGGQAGAGAHRHVDGRAPLARAHGVRAHQHAGPVGPCLQEPHAPAVHRGGQRRRARRAGRRSPPPSRRPPGRSTRSRAWRRARLLGAVTKVPAPPGARIPGPMAAMLVRTETGVSSAPVKRVRARLSRAREASAR